MGVFDNIKGFVEGNEPLKNIANKADELVGKAGGMLDGKTGGAVSKAGEFLEKAGEPLRRSADQAGEMYSNSKLSETFSNMVDSGRERLSGLVSGATSSPSPGTGSAPAAGDRPVWRIVPSDIEADR
jgi:hypothetical protein